ncbi:MAG: hypothetical protein WC755_06955 [Candidatus Woesearchaeota archaeon]
MNILKKLGGYFGRNQRPFSKSLLVYRDRFQSSSNQLKIFLKQCRQIEKEYVSNKKELLDYLSSKLDETKDWYMKRFDVREDIDNLVNFINPHMEFGGAFNDKKLISDMLSFSKQIKEFYNSVVWSRKSVDELENIQVGFANFVKRLNDEVSYQNYKLAKIDKLKKLTIFVENTVNYLRKFQDDSSVKNNSESISKELIEKLNIIHTYSDSQLQKKSELDIIGAGILSNEKHNMDKIEKYKLILENYRCIVEEEIRKLEEELNF